MKGTAGSQAGASTRVILGEAAGGGGRPVFLYRLERDQSGRITSKREQGPQGADVWDYTYDAGGRLATVRKNGMLAESYQYDESGRREQDFRAWAGERRLFTYYYDGSLLRVSGVDLAWTKLGQLASITENGRVDRFDYGRDSRLDQATLADGRRIRYEYGSELLPVSVLVNGRVAAEYVWQDMLCLSWHKDCGSGLSHDFLYGHGRVPEKVILRGPAGAVEAATGIYSSELVLDIWADQVESVRALSLPDGRPLKFLEYDAFGHVALDTRPEWRFPLGFACGLSDPWTGFVRFGFRDYDPRFGRFTSRDPLGDTGGDHDLWEYCVDDPVNAVDATGLLTEEPTDERSLFGRALAAWSPLLFGNKAEKAAKRKSALRSLRKEVGGIATGLTDLYTILPKEIPSNIPIWGFDNLTKYKLTERWRESGIEKKKKYDEWWRK